MQKSPVDTLSNYGKTFRFAGAFLSQKQLHQAARLYQFCRWIDDIGDEALDKQVAAKKLESIKCELIAGESSNAILSDFMLLQQELAIPIQYPICLIDGVLSDMGDVAVENVDELIQYAYRVAGVVGLMMCPILGADKRGYPHAIDLGIAMQLTNIARDVAEDATLGRRYLPRIWCNYLPHQLVDETQHNNETIKLALGRLLELADKYYESGRQGYTFLPSQSRRAIAVAANVYREIGEKLKRNGFERWRERTVIPMTNKIFIAVKTVLKPTTETNHPHNTSLHLPLRAIDVNGA